MQWQHYVMFVLLIFGGYIAGRLFPQFGQYFGLP